MSNIVKIVELKKSFGDTIAVDGITFDIKQGEIFGLLGPNGAGKSTTINIISGLLKKDHGNIECFDLDHAKKLKNIKQNIGVVPQDIAIYEDLKAIENVMFFASLYGLTGKLLKARALQALEFVGLTDRKSDYPKTFSGGMKRRLNIACAIAHQPKLIIMDEPTVGIDPQSRNHILDSVKQLNRMGSTVIYTTHYMEEAEAICSKIGIIDHGKLIAFGTTKELQSIITDVKTIEVMVDMDAIVDMDKLQAVRGIKRANRIENTIKVECLKESDITHDLTSFFKDIGVAIRGINMGDVSLETVFLSLTGRSLRD
jgi:ABC-2 type transport system ATP-binding protein